MGRVGQAITFDTCFVTLMKACRQAHTCMCDALQAVSRSSCPRSSDISGFEKEKKTCLLRVLVSEHMRTTFCKLSHRMSKQQ